MRTRRSKSTQGIQRSPLAKHVRWAGPTAGPVGSDEASHQVVVQPDCRLVERSPRGRGICPVHGSAPNRHSPTRMDYSWGLQVVRVSHQVKFNVVPILFQEEVEMNTTKEPHCAGARRCNRTTGEGIPDALDNLNPVL